MRKKVKQFKEDYTKTFIVIIAILAILFLIFWVKIGLYVNFMLGNDVLIKLDVDNDRFFLTNGEQENIKLEASVKTNPFCKAYCTLQFKELATNKILDQQELTLTAGNSFTKEYTLTNNNDMQGQDVYSFRLECQGKESFLCHTNKASTRRDMIITVDHNLNELQEEIKADSKTILSSIGNSLEMQSFIYEEVNLATQNITFKEITGELLLEKSKLEFIQGSISQMESLWFIQSFRELDSLMKTSSKTIKNKLTECKKHNNKILGTINTYNSLIETFTLSKTQITEISESSFTSNSMFLEVKQVILYYNTAIADFNSDSDLNSKISKADWIKRESDESFYEVLQEKEIEVLTREIEGDLIYDTLCVIDNNYCLDHPDILSRLEQENFNILESCQYLDDLNSDLNIIYNSIKDNVNSTYPKTDEFWENVSDIVSNKNRIVLSDYIIQFSPSHRNYDKINDIITVPELILEAGYSVPYIKNALIWQLIQDKPPVCTFINTPLPLIDNTTLIKITLSQELRDSIEFGHLSSGDLLNSLESEKSTPSSTIIPDSRSVNTSESSELYFLSEPIDQCCLLGECYDCCLTRKCRDNKDNYPIILVHGHAFNKDTSAEYSLDIFNDLQDGLEKDNYLSAGAINLYAEQEAFKDKWAKIPLPLTIKISYYFDLLQEEGNYQIVQTKSENIETYSLRLKEIIDVVKEKTDRPKVKIVAHSMGGLVVRRYLQIFGEDNVESITFVGTPHEGVVGQVAELCPVLGEELECRDLNEGSIFMRKLDLGGLPSLNITNIVGVGCDMDSEDGDGITIKRNTFMDEFNNYLIKGTCAGTAYLHSAMLDFQKHPETYDIILKGIE